MRRHRLDHRRARQRLRRRALRLPFRGPRGAHGRARADPAALPQRLVRQFRRARARQSHRPPRTDQRAADGQELRARLPQRSASRPAAASASPAPARRTWPWPPCARSSRRASRASSAITRTCSTASAPATTPAPNSSDQEAYRVALDTEVLLLDDLGAHRVTDWVEDTVTSIVTYRCNNRKPLIATTNLPDADAGSAIDREIRRWASRNTASRWPSVSARAPARVCSKCARSSACRWWRIIACERRGRSDARRCPAAGRCAAAAAGAGRPAGPAPRPSTCRRWSSPTTSIPRTLWERELVWLKTIGVRTVEFSIPWNWHQLAAGRFRFHRPHQPAPRPGRPSSGCCAGSDLRAWVRPLPPVAGWLNGGAARAAPERRAQRAWLQGNSNSCWPPRPPATAAPSPTWKGGALAIDAARAARARHGHLRHRSRRPWRAAARPSSGRRGALLWTDVEDALYPAGWEPDAGALSAQRRGGAERRRASRRRRPAPRCRAAAQLGAAARRDCTPVAMPKPAAGKLPDGVTRPNWSRRRPPPSASPTAGSSRFTTSCACWTRSPSARS